MKTPGHAIALQIPAGKVGPAMARLNARQQAFVMAMVTLPTVNHKACARAAGYSGDENVLAVTAHRLAHDEKIQAAIQEEAKRRIKASALIAATHLENIMSNPAHKDQLKAIGMVLNRAGLHEATEHTININDGQTDEALMDRIERLAERLGIDPEKLLGRGARPVKVSDVEFEEVDESDEVVDGTEGLEDLL